MSDTSSTYIAGVCNINPKEIAYRRKAGWAGLGIAAVVLVVVLLLDVASWWLVVVFLPLFVSALGFFQAKQHFCVSYAGQGMQNASGDKMDTAAKVSAADRAKDRLKANKIYLQSAAIAAIATAALILISYFIK